jgi:two-component system response regulator MtrA
MAGKKILIVDDDHDIRKLLGHRLKSRGYEPVFAGDAISAVNQARKERPDQILLDLPMPAGDGYVGSSNPVRTPSSASRSTPKSS